MDLTALSNRLLKRKKQLAKWARKNDVSCFRLYEKDIPEFPLIVDWYDGDVVVWFYRRTMDDSESKEKEYTDTVTECLMETFSLSPDLLHVKRRYRQTEQYEKISKKEVLKIISEQGLKFVVNLSDYLDTGIFLDHRNTRKMVRDMSDSKRVLNLFAYTGAFTCYAIDGGAAATTTVDMSVVYCEWAKRNILTNGFGLGDNHRIIAADCLAFLEDPGEEKYDIIVCDPPTFSNSKRMDSKSFEVERDQVKLLTACHKLLVPGGTLFFSNNYRKFELREDDLSEMFSIREITNQSIPNDFRNKRIHRCWQMTAI